MGRRRSGPSRYQPLADHLAAQAGDEVALTFAQIEALIGGPLPPSARIASYWTGTLRPHTAVWRAMGWRAHYSGGRESVRFAREK